MGEAEEAIQRRNRLHPEAGAERSFLERERVWAAQRAGASVDAAKHDERLAELPSLVGQALSAVRARGYADGELVPVVAPPTRNGQPRIPWLLRHFARRPRELGGWELFADVSDVEVATSSTLGTTSRSRTRGVVTYYLLSTGEIASREAVHTMRNRFNLTESTAGQIVEPIRLAPRVLAEIHGGLTKLIARDG